MNKKAFYELVTKELCGTATRQDLKMLWEAIDRDNLQEEYQRIKDNWDQQLTEIGANPYNIDRARQRVISKVREVEPGFVMDSMAVAQSKPSFNWLKIAAVITLLVTVGGWLWQHALVGQVEEKTQISWIDKSTRPGQNSTITFQDGSSIVLNGNSSIRFPQSFEGSTREVYFSGEGYFDIATDPTKPFIVHMEGYSVKVLGTIFNINHSQPDQLKVALLEGKVVVGEDAAEDKVVLKPGEQAAFDKPGKRVVIAPFDPEEVMGWKDKKYVFNGEPLLCVLSKLERRYGVSFEYTEEQVSSCELTASFEDETVWTIMEAIKYATGLDYELKANKVVSLKGRGCIN